jgi:hypothetical protein
MSRPSLLITVCLLATAFGAGALDPWPVRLDGIGPVRVGMDLPDLNKVLHTSYSKPTDPDEQSCFYVDVPHQPGVGIMILDGHVARVDVDHDRTRTAEGVRKGDTEAHALEVYGRKLGVTPSHYDPESGHLLTLFSRDRKFGIRFETEDGNIVRYYAGTVRAIALIEGCS